MFRMKSKASGVSSPVARGSAGGVEAVGVEVRPGGMLVQKRTVDSNQNAAVGQIIKVRVKHGSSYHELSMSSQASFGEMKKLLAGPTGLHPQDQRLMYKDKEMDSKVFLDLAGVKNGSKLVLLEDELSRERRCLESRRNVKTEKGSKEIASIKFEVDQLVKQIIAVEMEISRGKKVMESDIMSLIELLMTQLIKLDGVAAEGDLKLQRRMQVKRVQKYIENLDMLKLRNYEIGKGSFKLPLVQQHVRTFTGQKMAILNHQRNFDRSQTPVIITTNWETF